MLFLLFFADGGEPPRVVIEDPEITRPKAGIIKKLLFLDRFVEGAGEFGDAALENAGKADERR